MKTYKILLLSLLMLISLSSIFTKPGFGTLPVFNNDLTKYETSKITGRNVLENFIFVKYPPSTFLILSSIMKFFPLDPAISLFYRQNTWLIYKIVLYIFYLFSWLALLYLAKNFKKNIRMPFLDTSIAYFGSVSIILSTLGLSFLDIFAVPFFLLSISFLNKNKLSLAGLFYILAISFNWTLLALFPIYFAYTKRMKNNKISSTLSFLVIPLILTLSFCIRSFLLRSNFLTLISHTKIFGFPLPGNNTDPMQIIIFILLLLTYIISIGFLLNKLLFQKIWPNRKNVTISFIISLILIVVSLLAFNSPIPVFLLIMATISYYLYKKVVITTQLSPSFFTVICLGQYLSFLIFTQSSDGNLIWLTILALTFFILKKSKFSYFQLLLFNIIVFIKLFAFWSISGVQTVRGNYFEFFQYIFTAIFILFSAYYITRINKFNLTRYTKLGKLFIIIFMILFIFSLIPAQGTGTDSSAWINYANETVKYSNPFKAHVVKEVDQLYPPLTTVIFAVFANLWKNIIGQAPKYHIAIKISVLTFYTLSVWALIKFKTSKIDLLGTLNKLLVILTTFSLIIQTQGLDDINIYVIPTLILAIFFLFKKKYMLSGLLFGITISIKWQPVILIPLFGAYLFDLKQNFSLALKNILVFSLGFITCPVFVWTLVYLQPWGSYTIGRSFDFILNGAAGLSGQAMNLNWIATYLLHIFQPSKYLSLAEVDYYNRIIPTYIAPKILQGYFFFIAAGVILLRFWLFAKKNIYNFSKAALMIFFTHHILNKSAYDRHLIYTVVFMLLLYLIRPTGGNKKMLILIDIMAVMNMVMFFGITGPTEMNRLFFGIDITVVFAILYVIIYFWIFIKYIRSNKLPLENK